jgi:hypothetical protein
MRPSLRTIISTIPGCDSVHRIFLYLICHDFRKIFGRTKIFDKCTSGVVPHGVRLLPPYPTVLSPCRRGARRQESISCATVGSAAPGPCRRVTRTRIRASFDEIILLKQRQNHDPRGGVNRLMASSSRMVVPFLTTTSRRSPPFTWCCVSWKACRSSSRPSLARRPVLGRTAASPTSFPLEEPSHDKSPSRTTSLRLARQVSALHDKSPPRTTSSGSD